MTSAVRRPPARGSAQIDGTWHGHGIMQCHAYGLLAALVWAAVCQQAISQQAISQQTVPQPVAVREANHPFNVVMIMVDDMGWTDLACYGSDLHETPHLDGLARSAIRFTHAYAAASICSPTRAAFLTGKSPVRLGMTIWREAALGAQKNDGLLAPPDSQPDLPFTEITLAEALQKAGYTTWHVGKWHLGDAAGYPEAHGFDINVGGTLWGAPASYFWPFRGATSREFRYVPGLYPGKPGDYLTDRLTDAAIHLIHSHPTDKPFFLNLCFHSVHTPIEGKPELVSHYEQKIAQRNPTHHRHPTYAAMVHCVDQSVGRVLHQLTERGLADRTVVIFTSDNGGVSHPHATWGTITSNDPLRSGKGSLYEGGIRVPLIIKVPQLTRAHQTCDAPVVTQDLYPTLRDLIPPLQQSAEQPFDGISLQGLLSEPQAELPREALHWHYPHYYPTTSPVSAIRLKHHKLLHFYEGPRLELYDLQTDPGESTDLSAQQPELAKQLDERLQQWLHAMGGRLPRANRQAP